MTECGVYAAITSVQGELAKVGIGKNKKNTQQGYSFRGIDDVYDVLSPLLAKNNLCILPRVISRTCIERQTKAGGALFNVAVECEFDLVSSLDGSKHTIKTYGEAMDSADKATNKAMSAAYKYAAFQTFCIPVDVEDADKTTPQEVIPAPPKAMSAAYKYPESAPWSDMATKAQVQKIQILMREHGLTERADVLQNLTEFFGRMIKSSKDLTKEEASEFIDVCEKEKAA